MAREKEKVFRFRHFSLRQDRSLMPLTTDSILLGAWVDCQGAAHILDIGAGSGAVTLLLARRCGAAITALEPDEGSCLDLRENILASPWHERIREMCMTLQEFAASAPGDTGFDLIVSNPPFFVRDTLPADSGRGKVRHALTLTHGELLQHGVSLLSGEGRLCLILPARYEEPVIADAAALRLYCNRLLRVRPTPEKEMHRVVLELSRMKRPLHIEELVLREEGKESRQWKELTGAYLPGG